MQDEIAHLGKYADKAKLILGENSSCDDIIELASKFQDEEERDEENQE